MIYHVIIKPFSIIECTNWTHSCIPKVSLYTRGSVGISVRAQSLGVGWMGQGAWWWSYINIQSIHLYLPIVCVYYICVCDYYIDWEFHDPQTIRQSKFSIIFLGGKLSY